MRYLANATEMKKVDELCIKHMNIPSLALMERAGYSVYEEICHRFDTNNKILVVASTGNNGADGLVIARYLHNDNYDVSIYIVGDMNKASEEFNIQYSIVKNMNIAFVDKIIKSDVIVDAIFGIGLSKEIKGSYKKVIEDINDSKARVVSVDIASGIFASTGEIFGIAVKADLTVTFGLDKLGTLLGEGRLYSGVVVVKKIGFLNSVIDGIDFEAYTLDKEELFDILPKRKINTHKGSFGKLLVVAGHKTQAGACYLNVTAAYKVGTGLVTIYTDKSNRNILQTLIPEAVMNIYGEDDYDVEIEDLVKKASTILIGSGLGTDERAFKIFERVLELADVPLVIDADGINMLTKNNIDKLEGKRVIITPHILEMKRLCERLDIIFTDNYLELAKRFVEAYNITLVLKNDRTIVAKKGEKIYVNVYGNNAMSKAGSGDVLAGIIAGFCNYGLSDISVAVLGVLVHSLCGDVAKENINEYSVLARDLIAGLDYVLKSRREDE